MLRAFGQFSGIAKRFSSTVATPAPYFISRTANQGLPVYTEIKNGGTQKLTIVRRIEGDAEVLMHEIRVLFPKDAPKNIVRVNPTNNQVIIKGIHGNEIKQWLIEKGF
ncbi:mitochondrial large subunit ribosomal protein-domain-containing protein [Phycomyces blakesleeanus]|uniref:Large ribosomal subunit protein mL49 n=1 Tax=Phycomyces blakesleeanus TaxID=4837 RepID=A0ABR3ARW3_PHYBL